MKISFNACKKNGISDLFILIVLFVGIFMPCIVRIRMQYFVFAIELLFIFTLLIKLKTFKINRNLVCMLASFIPFFVYYSLIVFINMITKGNSGSLYKIEYTQALSNAVYVVATVMALQLLKNYKEFELDRFYKLLIAVGIVQLTCVILSFLFPSVKSFFNNLTIRNSYSEKYSSFMQIKYYMTWRAYGFAENLFDGFGYVISILITGTFVYGISKNSKKVISLSILMLLMPLLNARTGLLLCFISFIIIMFHYNSPKAVLKYILAGSVIIILFPFMFNLLPNGLQSALLRGITQTTDLLSGKGTTGVYEDILIKDVVFPNDILIGAGISPERISDYRGIDSGYIQCIWRFGFIGSLLLFGAFIYCFIIAYRVNRKKENRALVLSIMIVFFVYCFKLFFFASYANNFLLFSLLTMIVLDGTTSIKLNPSFARE